MEKLLIFDNYRWFNFLLKRAYLYIIGVSLLFIAFLLYFSGTLAYKYLKLTSKDNIYVLTKDNLQIAKRRETQKLHRNEHEVMVFTNHVLEKLFSNNEYTFEENQKEALSYMDEDSARLIFEKIHSRSKTIYKLHNGITYIKITKLRMNVKKSPMQVYVEYCIYGKYPAKEKIMEENYDKRGMYYEIRPCERSQSNPFGIQMQNVEFGIIQ